jgi:hypothetical protein
VAELTLVMRWQFPLRWEMATGIEAELALIESN